MTNRSRSLAKGIVFMLYDVYVRDLRGCPRRYLGRYEALSGLRFGKNCQAICLVTMKTSKTVLDR